MAAVILGALLFLGIPVCGAGAAEPKHVMLELRHQRQSVNLCVPTSASMILDYYGEKHDPQYLKSIATPPGSTFDGTYIRDLLAGLRRIGIRWSGRCFATNDAGYSEGMPLLRQSLSEGRPVMVGMYDPPIGHVVVLVGFDDAKGQLTLQDPARPFPGLWTLREEDFRLAWRENVVDLRCATFTWPR